MAAMLDEFIDALITATPSPDEDGVRSCPKPPIWSVFVRWNRRRRGRPTGRLRDRRHRQGWRSASDASVGPAPAPNCVGVAHPSIRSRVLSPMLP